MKNESTDPRIDRMMAALYGELSESENRAFHRLLETDDALRAEWEELQASRGVLAAWKVEERVPSFVMLEGEAAPSAAARRPGGAGWFQRLIEPLRGFGTSPAWGVATAVVATAAFLIADSRVDDKVAREIAALRAPPAPTSAPAATLRESAPVELRSGIQDADPSGTILQASDEYVTKADFQNRNDALVQSLVTLLNEYGERQDQETLDLMQAMYERVNQQQLYDYRQLSGRVENVRRELVASRSIQEQTIEDLLGPAAPRDEAQDLAPLNAEE